MAPAKLVQCICGSTKVWPSSGEEEEIVGLDYAVDAFILSGISDSAFFDLSGVYYRTPETLTYANQALPIYKSADGLNTMSFASTSNTRNNVWSLSRSSNDKSAILATEDPSYSDLYPRNLSLFEGKSSGQGDWWSVGTDTNFEISSVIETHSMAIKFETTDASASGEFNGTYVANGNFTTYNGVQYPIYYCSDTNKYLYVRGDSGNPDSTAGYVNPGELTIRNDNASCMLHGLSGIDNSGFIRIDWLNEASANGLYYEAGENESMNPGTVFWSTEIVDSGSSSSSSNIKLQGFTGTVEDSGGTYQVDEEYNGVYTDTGTTNTVTYYDSSIGDFNTITAPIYYNGARYLFLYDYSNMPTWAVGTTSSSIEYICTSTGSELSSIIGSKGWIFEGVYSSIQITASWTDEAQSHGGSTPAVTTFTLTVNYSGTAPSGAKWIVNNNEYDFGSSATLEAGTYTITYKAVSGYTTPSSQSVTGTAGGSETITANAYVAESTSYPNAFVVAGHSTDNYNGTYVKQSTTITYNGTAYPVYYNGVYYLWHHQSSAAACLGTSSDISYTASSMPYYYVSGGGKSISDLTASDLTGQWSLGGGMTYESLTFTESSSTTPSAGSGEGTAPSSGTPYLYLTNSSTTTYNGYYALVSGTPSSSGNGGSKWKHVAKNYWIGYYYAGSSSGPRGWHVYSNANSVGTENNIAQQNVGNSSSSVASTLFAGGATRNGYTITYEDNGYS